MNKYVLEVMRLLYYRRRFILTFTLLSTVVAAMLELFYYHQSRAEVVLVVTDITAGESLLGKVLPPRLNTKAYEDLLNSTPVVGKTLERLIEKGIYESEDSAPELREFRAMLSTRVVTVDQTTRPVTYAPYITLTAIANSQRNAEAKVETWAEVGMEVARRLSSMNIDPLSRLMKQEEQMQSKELERVRQSLAREKAENNTELLKARLDRMILLLVELQQSQETAASDLYANRERVAALQGSLKDLPETIEVFRAPSEDAYFLSQAVSSDPAKLEALRGKGMISQEVNLAYVSTREAEQLAIADAAAAEARVTSLNRQIDALEAEIERLQADLAVHERVQTRLQDELAVELAVYTDVSQLSSLISIASVMNQGPEGEMISTVGLNRIQKEVYSEEYSAVGGKKARVVMIAIIALFLSAGAVLLLHFGQPFIETVRQPATK